MNSRGSRPGGIAFFVNPAAGGGRGAEAASRVRELCAGAGQAARVTTPTSVKELRTAVESALADGIEVLVAGGGDGTVSVLAGYLADRSTSLGILPLGSSNHFARDLGIPLGLDDAVAVTLAGSTQSFDVGEVNGRVFVNNSSLGLYPLIVRVRARHHTRGLARRAITVLAALREIRRHPEIAVRIEVAGEAMVHQTPIVFIANNQYRAAGLEAGTRDSLHDGLLAIYIVKAAARRHLLRLAVKVLAGRVREDELEVLLAPAASIESRAVRLPMAIDGEVEEFEPPLEYRVRPGALRVMVPPASASPL